MNLLTLIPDLVGSAFKLIDKNIEDKDLAQKLKFDLQQTASNEWTEALKASRDVVVAEAKSDHWITATWRPITMLTFVFIIANNYIIYPYLSLFSDAAPKLEIPPDMWALLKIGLGGYVVGRSVEKAAEHWRK